MIPDRALWLRVRPLFDELADLDPDARQARLKSIGQDDQLLRDSLERLLGADSDAESALRDYSFGEALTPTANATHQSAAQAPGSDDRRLTDGGSRDAGPSSNDPLGVLGRTVSHFHVTDFVASGGMGVVYRAEDSQLARTVALKFPLPNQRLESAVRERFVNEARSAGSLDHPNLCSIHEVGESAHGLFLAMPLYPGETLKDCLARDGTLKPAEALDIIRQVTQGLACAHAAGVIHRDLKPANVMLLPDGTVRVLDFGLAKIRDSEMTKSRSALGTIGYVAPEQVRGGPVDARTDLWAIGVLLYEAATGVRPFRGDFEGAVLHAVLNDTPVRPSVANPELPSSFDDVVGALLEKDPSDRYASAEQLLPDLDALQRGVRPAALPRPGPRSRFVRQLRGRRVPLGLGIVAALALAAVAADAWRDAAGRDRGGSAAGSQAVSWTGDTAYVTNGSQLVAVLIPANAGRHVRLSAGLYDVERPLTVPDGMTLEGAGVMAFNPDGLPEGFAEATRTVLRMAANVGGDMLTLGTATRLSNLEVQDLAGRSGNLVAVSSRRPNDSVSTAISQVVVVNPNPHSIGPGGAMGRGLYVVTRNANLGADPAPDTGSVVDVRMESSIIRSPAGGGGFFAFNFAANSRISLHVSRSLIGGSNEANGGVSRPDAVHDSEVRITSEENVYRNEWADPCAPASLGWNITGGSGAPIPFELPETARNTLVFHSTRDRIEAFTTGVLATGSRQFFEASLNAVPSRNHIALTLIGTTISTPSCPDTYEASQPGDMPRARSREVADLSLVGASVGENYLRAGNGNTLLVELRGVTGSGRRDNLYANTSGVAGELPPSLQGEGNRLWIRGDVASFARENRGIEPVPPAEYFTSSIPEPILRENTNTRANPPIRRPP